MTEHVHRYEKLGQLLVDNGILMFGHDHGMFISAIGSVINLAMQGA